MIKNKNNHNNHNNCNDYNNHNNHKHKIKKILPDYKMKNTQSKIKPIKTEKKPETMYCLGCKDYTPNRRHQEVKMANKVLRETVLFVDRINQDF